MSILRNKDIKNMKEQERKEKIKELKMELIKKNVAANKGSKIKAKEIKKAIARLLSHS